MSEEKKISEGELLYDPMFAKKPVTDWTDSEGGGFFGKAVVKKTLFIIILLIAIGGSLVISFSSLSKDRYKFEALDNGTYMLEEFHGQKNDAVLNIDYVRGDDGTPDKTKTVAQVRKYTVTGNDTLQFIFIGRDVSDIEKTAFYYCSALNAVFVDDENENYADIDGVLYKKENGVITEAVFCPQQHTKYMLALSMGEKAPTDNAEADVLAKKLLDTEYDGKLQKAIEDEKNTVGKILEIPETVTKIDQLCFAYCDKLTSIKLPSGLKEIETMAFFKCEALAFVELPDSLEKIGSDAFSKCKEIEYIFIPANVKEIGHHAFWECKKIEKVYMSAESLDGISVGQNWLPQYRKTFMKNRDIVFSAERGVK